MHIPLIRQEKIAYHMMLSLAEDGKRPPDAVIPLEDGKIAALGAIGPGQGQHRPVLCRDVHRLEIVEFDQVVPARFQDQALAAQGDLLPSLAAAGKHGNTVRQTVPAIFVPRFGGDKGSAVEIAFHKNSLL